MTDPGDRTRFIGRVFESSATLANGETLTISAGDTTTNGLEVQQIVFGSDCTVTLEADKNEDGTFEHSVEIDSFTGTGISQGNEIRLSTDKMRLVVENTGTEADYIVTGEEMAP